MFIVGSPDSGEVFAEGEGLFVSIGLDGVGIADLEGWSGDKAGTATQGERNGDSFNELVVAVVNLNWLFLRDVESDE